jgi:FtsH-binding integral membrane protein
VTNLIRKPKKSAAVMNPYLYSAVVTIFVTTAWSAANYFLGQSFDYVDALLFGVIFWAVFLATTMFMRRRLKKKQLASAKHK